MFRNLSAIILGLIIGILAQSALYTVLTNAMASAPEPRMVCRDSLPLTELSPSLGLYIK